MSQTRVLKIVAIITYLLLAPLAYYFKYFPTFVNAVVSNILLSLSVFILISLLVYGAFIIKKSKDIYLLLPQSLIFVFIARAVPNLRLSYPPLHDPYYHFVSTLNILQYGTLKPILEGWYEGVDAQLHWPDMHLITTTLANITNIDIMQFFRFQEPAMGVIFFLAVFFLAKTVTKNDGVALLAGLFASINDIIIFYQSEYHPQGLSIVYFILLLYTFIKSRQINDVRYRYLALLFGFVFVLSHYFTPLFLALIFSSYIAMLLGMRFLSSFRAIQSYINVFEIVKSDYNYFLFVIIFSLSYHLFAYYKLLKIFLSMATTESILRTPLITIGNSNVPLIASILSSSKWGMFILAIISIAYIFKIKSINQFRLGILVVCMIFAGVIGNYIIASPLDRLIGFYVPLAAVFASLTLFRFRDSLSITISKSRKIILVALIASTIITLSFFNSQTPAYFFKDSETNTYYWYSNKLPNMDEYKAAGEWFGVYTLPNAKVEVEFDTRTIPLYYGKRSDRNILYQPTHQYDYLFVNPSIPYEYKGYEKMFFDKDLDAIYNNKELKVFIHPKQSLTNALTK